MLLSLSLMVHPRRSKYLPYLFEKLGQIPVALDTRNSITDTCERAWKLYVPSAKYHCVIQDDAIIGKNFRERAERALSRENWSDKMAYNFYYGVKRGLENQQKQGRIDGYIIRNTPGWGVAICLPTKLIPAMLNHFIKLTQPQDDVRIGDYLVKNNIPIYFPLPSLVDHRHEEQSLVGDKGQNRKAFWFIGTE